jgi:Icc-related predicted phosphoesterase
MKLQVISDLHLEFQGVPAIENTGSNILILGGDICLAEHLYRNPTAGLDNKIQNGWYANDAIRYREFFKYCSSEWRDVLYVMGNHEHYSGRWNRTEEILREELVRYPNIKLLEQNKMVIDDVVFLGASLWTDMNNQDPITIHAVRDMMSDYRAITEINGSNYHKLRPITTVQKHVETVSWLKMMLGEDKRKTVVVTHHAPSRMSVHPKYQSQTLMNGAFVSGLENIMLDNDHLVLWTHGHVHDPWDYFIGNTRVFCNPHGYPGEILKWDPNKILEI